MVHKLRKAMGNRDACYTLVGMLEIDQGFFAVEASKLDLSKGVRGKGDITKTTLLEDTDTGK